MFATSGRTARLHGWPFDGPEFFDVTSVFFGGSTLANHASAWKRMRQNVVRRARNVHFKSFVRSRVRKVREAVSAGNSEGVSELLKQAISAIDTVSAKGIIHRNTASRRVARLSKLVHGFLSSKA